MARGKRTLELTHPNASGIDIGSVSHFVAVPPGRSETDVREFKSFTEDLEALADWLVECEVDIVAMESTGVYWIPLYELLESRGITVYLVNARHVKNVSGRKSDVMDCQWLQQLMSYGLLSAAFRPKEEICALRTFTRQWDMLHSFQTRHVQHVQKALAQMNVQLTNVISDVMGVTGQAIIRAILAGERDPHKLAKLRDRRIRESQAVIAKSLRGNWREEHLFALKQAVDLYDCYRAALAECETRIEQQLERLYCHDAPPPLPKNKRGPQRKDRGFDLRIALQRVCGVDLTRIHGISTATAMKVMSEVGPDFSRFRTAKNFCSWLGLCPGTKISGGKVLSGATKRTANRLAQALRMAALALGRTQSALGAYFRRMSGRLDKSKAITATAHKLARLIYTLVTKGTEYLDRGQGYYEERYNKRVLHNLNRRAASLGFALTPIQPEALLCQQ